MFRYSRLKNTRRIKFSSLNKDNKDKPSLSCIFLWRKFLRCKRRLFGSLCISRLAMTYMCACTCVIMLKLKGWKYCPVFRTNYKQEESGKMTFYNDRKLERYLKEGRFLVWGHLHNYLFLQTDSRPKEIVRYCNIHEIVRSIFQFSHISNKKIY